MNLLFDMDGVIAGIEEGFWDQFPAYWRNAHIVKPEDRRTFYCIDELPEEQVPAGWALLNSKGFFENLPAIKGAIEGMEKLLSYHDVRICTAPMRSSRYCISEKIAWVRREMGKHWLERLIITKDKTYVRGDVLIDDKPEVTGALKPTWEHIVFDAPYNREAKKPRVWGWEGVMWGFGW